jgi:hypothetical protein
MIHWTLMCAFSVLAGLVVAETVVNVCRRPRATDPQHRPRGPQTASDRMRLSPGSRRIGGLRPQNGETDTLSLR